MSRSPLFALAALLGVSGGCKREAASESPRALQPMEQASPLVDAGPSQPSADAGVRAHGDLPPAAEQRRRDILDALRSDDLRSLRQHLIADFTFSFGEAPSAEAGIAFLQDNQEMKRKLVALLEGPCLFELEMKRVICPPEAAEGEYFGLRTGLLEDEAWKLGFFVAGD